MENNFSSDLGCFIIRINRTRRRFLSRYLKEFGLSWPMHIVLHGIRRYPGRCQEFLSDYCFIDKTVVARYARKLELLSYIRREVAPEDRRLYKLYLTPAGEKCAESIQRHSDEWSRQLAAGFTDGERRAALALLSRMSGNINALFQH